MLTYFAMAGTSSNASYNVVPLGDDLSLSGLSLAGSGAASLADSSAASPADSGPSPPPANSGASPGTSQAGSYVLPSGGGAPSDAASFAYSGPSPPPANSGASPGTSLAGSYQVLDSGGAPSELASGGAPSEPASGGDYALADAASAADGDSVHSSGSMNLDRLRTMHLVSSRLRPVPESREIDARDLPDRQALQRARGDVEECLAHIAQLDAVLRQDVDGALPLGAAAGPEGGTAAPTPAVGGELERMHSLIASSDARLQMAKAELSRLEALMRGGDGSPASGGGDPAHWRAGFEAAAPPAEWEDRSDAGSATTTYSAPARLQAAIPAAVAPPPQRAVPGTLNIK